jgi:hypothetical protein
LPFPSVGVSSSRRGEGGYTTYVSMTTSGKSVLEGLGHGY